MDTLENAFTQINRADFLPESKKDLSHLDIPIPIGFGQTNSQPSTVKRMLKWLDVKNGDTVLDIGSGSGWTTALLSSLVGENGHIVAVELIPELLAFGKRNCQKYDLHNIEFFLAKKGVYGHPDKSPFDRILVSATASDLPEELLKQIRPGGKMVIPVRSQIVEVTKRSDVGFTQINHPGFVFVPLV